MSHSIYKKKAWVETEKGDLLPLVLCADSNLSDNKGRYIYTWGIYNFGKGIVISKDLFKKCAEEKYNDEINRLIEFQKAYDRNGSSEQVGGETHTYYGTVYPGGSKMKHQKTFHSTRKTIPINEFLRKHKIQIQITLYNRNNYQTIEEETVDISNEENVYVAQSKYEEMKLKYPECDICLGIYGLDSNL